MWLVNDGVFEIILNLTTNNNGNTRWDSTSWQLKLGFNVWLIISVIPIINC